MKQDRDDFFGTEMIVVALRHVGKTTWLSEVLKMSLKTYVNSTADSLN